MKTKKESKWETQEGELIPYSKLGDLHLLNILNWIEKRAKNGMLIVVGGEGWDMDGMWGYQYMIEGEEVYQKYDYHNLVKEAKKRGLVKNITKIINKHIS